MPCNSFLRTEMLPSTWGGSGERLGSSREGKLGKGHSSWELPASWAGVRDAALVRF